MSVGKWSRSKPDPGTSCEGTAISPPPTINTTEPDLRRKDQSRIRSLPDRRYFRHYVATSTTSIFVVENISSTIMVYSIPGALVNGRTACHQCIKQQAGGTGWNSDPT